MIQRLRTLERLLVCQRAQVLIGPIAEAFIDAWQQALDQDVDPPDELDLVQAVAAEGVPVLALSPLESYLDQCRRDRRVPHPGRIVQVLVHGFAESRLRFARTCACPDHLPLAPSRLGDGGAAR